MAKKASTPDTKGKSTNKPARFVAPISPVVLENLRAAIARILAAFPATPKISSPDPGSYVWGVPPFGGPSIPLLVGLKTNRTTVAYRLTVVDLTDSGNVIAPIPIPAPLSTSFFASVPGNQLISGHDFRIRIEVDPGVAGANDEFDTVYVSAI